MLFLRFVFKIKKQINDKKSLKGFLFNRRVVWRSHSLNAASLAAVRRFGFQFECFFKNYSVSKGRNRNNVWFAIVVEDWPELDRIYESWLQMAVAGKHQSLSLMTAKKYGIFVKQFCSHFHNILSSMMCSRV